MCSQKPDSNDTATAIVDVYSPKMYIQSSSTNICAGSSFAITSVGRGWFRVILLHTNSIRRINESRVICIPAMRDDGTRERFQRPVDNVHDVVVKKQTNERRCRLALPLN